MKQQRLVGGAAGCSGIGPFLFYFLLGTQPYKETCGDKHKTRHRGCRDDVPMYREQLDRPGVSALALQPGIEKKKGGGAWSGSKNNNLVRERGEGRCIELPTQQEHSNFSYNSYIYILMDT